MKKPMMSALGVALMVSLLLVPAAVAQNPTASLIGRVTDADGAALPGVQITAESPNLQGERSSFAGTNGDYKVAFLPPGDYTLTYTLDGLGTVIKELKLSAAQTAISNIEMKVSDVSETITVTGELATISETTTASSTYSKNEVEKLAISRDLQETALLAPGVTATGPGSTEENPRISIGGAMSFENLFLVNGVVVNENLRGQELPLFIEDAIQETTVSTSSISAEYGRFTGGVVNAITKSGGNQLDGSLRVNLVNDDWISRNDLSPERLDDVNDVLEGTLGGAFWKDHLWFFTAGRDRATSASETTNVRTSITYPTSDEEQRIEAKLTLAATPKHSLIGTYLEIDRTRTNTDFGNILDLRSLNASRQDPQEIKSLNYTGIVSNNFFVEAQYSERDFTIGIGSGGVPDLIEGTLVRQRPNNQRFWAPTFCGSCEDEIRNNENALVKGSYFLTTEKAGSHDLVFGYDTFDDIRFAVNHQTGSDFTVYASEILIDGGNNIFPVFRNDNAWVRWFAIINLDIAQPTSFTTNSFYVNDSWQVSDKLSLSLGVRFDENDGTNSAGALVTDDSKVAPRFGANYDLKGDGDLILRGSFGTYVAAIANNRADSTSGGGAVSDFRYDYGGPEINTDPDCIIRGDCTTTDQALREIFDWYESVGGRTDSPFLIDPNAPINGFNNRTNVPGETSIIRGALASPSTDEFTLGLSKRLGNRGSFRADFVSREWTDFYSNRTTLDNGTVTLPNGNLADLQLVGNFGNSQLEREYTGLHTQFRYRVSDRLTVSATYALSKLEGNINGESGNGGPATVSPNDFPEYKEERWNTPTGDLSADQRHKLRAWAVYDLIDNDRHSLSVSLLQNFFSGTPYGLSGGVDTRPFVGDIGYQTPPRSVTYFFSDRAAFKTDDITRLDLSFNYSFKWNAFGRSMEVFIQPEILNLLDEDGIVNVNDDIEDEANGGNCPLGAGGDCEAFNPFTETPIEGVHFARGDLFGQPEDENDIQRSRLFRISVGFRF